MDNTRDLRVLIASHYPLILAQTADEQRFMSILRRAAQTIGVPVWTWSVTNGLQRDGSSDAAYQTKDPDRALQFIEEAGQPGVFVFADIQYALQNPVVVRRIKDVAQAGKQGVTLVLTSPRADIPPELGGLALPWELEPPGKDELGEIVGRTLNDLAARNVPVSLDAHGIEQLVEAIRGVSVAEAGLLIQQAALDDGTVDVKDVEFVRRAKAHLLESSGVLELVESTAGTLDNVGGMQHLKEWLAIRARAFDDGAEEFGLDPPRGVLITGVPGCGKSLVAKTLARTWGLPLLLLDPARLYASYVGQSEQRLRDCLKTVEAMAPVMLWIDEIEKGFAADEMGDGGVSQRQRGTFLRWMQDRPPGIFVVATCNQVLSLPPEFLRKGRFDEMFFVDLPGAEERKQIFRLHLHRRKHDPAAFDLDGLASASEGFSGAEIEAAVVGGLYRAFADKRELDTGGLLSELATTSPLSKTRAEEIAALRAWADGRAVPA